MVRIFRNAWTSLMCACSPFRLQMHWEEGYLWQEQTHEYMKFCMMHSYRGYPGYGRCFYGATNDESGPCLDDAVYIAECNSDRRQQWTFIELRNGQFQIKAVSSGECMEKIDWKTIRMRPCDSSEERQRFREPSPTEFKNVDATTPKGDEFIISQGASRLCMGGLHHPKQGEVMEMQYCQNSIKSDTLFWEKN